MKAGHLLAPGRFEIVDVPIPTPGAGEAVPAAPLIWTAGVTPNPVIARLAKKTRVALSWVLEMIFSKDLEQMLTLRDVELISRIATSPTEMC